MAKYAAYGTILNVGGVIAQVRNVSGPNLTLDTDDVTTHDSTAAWEEHVGTILRSGEVTFDLVYDPGDASHQSIFDQMVARAAVACTIAYPDLGTTTVSFSALVTGLSPEAPHEGQLSASCTLKPTGAVTGLGA